MSELNKLQLKNILANPDSNINDILDNYHEADIADALEELTKEERHRLYSLLNHDILADVFTHLEDPSLYLEELTDEHAVKVLNEMDADDVIDALEDLETDDRAELIKQLDKELQEDVSLIVSYSEDEVGSKMTTNFNKINRNSSIKEAMKQVIQDAREFDNINIIYVINDDQTYYGAIHLRDLIIARSSDTLDSITYTNYPVLHDHENIAEVIEHFKDYALEYIPVLNSKERIIGILTSDDIIEAVDKELSEDFSKLAGLASESKETDRIFQSVKKRLPWLSILLVFDLFISMIVSRFEDVIAIIPILAAFQPLLLDMAGNSGTQSLAVTLLTINDEKLTSRKTLKIVGKELRIGLLNGLYCGIVGTLLIGIFILVAYQDFTVGGKSVNPFIFSGIIGFSLFIGVIVSCMVGCLIPMLFKSLKVDPATASGPFITSINDIVSVLFYFGIIILVFKTMLNLF